MLDSSGNSRQGPTLGKLEALCFERGCLLLFDKQDMVEPSLYVHISEHFPTEAQDIGGHSLKRGVSQAQDTTLLIPQPLLCP